MDASSRAGWQVDKAKQFEYTCEVSKVDLNLGLVFGWGVISTENGEPYFDLQKDHISDVVMLNGATHFMLESRKVDDMHDEGDHGVVVHSFPLTAEIAGAFEIQTDHTDWMIAVKPDDAKLSKFADGTYTGFSIGGMAMREELETE